MNGRDREEGVAEAFVALADTLVDDYDVVDLLEQLVGYGVTLLAVDAAGLLLADLDGDLRLVASTSERGSLLEVLQLQAAEGPCLDCFRSGQAVSVSDLGAERERWPRFVAEAERQGIAAVHAVPLRLRRETVGALGLFGFTPGAVPADDLRLAQALADVATIGILHERALHRSEVRAEQLQVALNSRIVIEQAKGVLAERGGIDVDTAFATLRRYTRSNNLKLSDVARRLVEGTLDADDLLAGRRPQIPG